jgi:glycosyltransferase involved in cell wall biosynthesis
MVNPIISVLVTTFNRKDLLKRCIERVLVQTFTDFELIIIDDCSTDGTDALIASFSDSRIKHIRNSENIGSKLGDRAHIKRFVYELSRGDYFVYVCDDDYWISNDLLERQVALTRKYPNAAMITGSQLSCFLADGESAPLIDQTNLHEYVGADLTTCDPKLHFFKNVFPRVYMTSDEFLEYFAKNPANANILGGATLYQREMFIRSGTLQSMTGSKWQAGYELRFGPAAYGDCIYMNEPCLLGEIRQQNASFGRTQLEHYHDCIISITTALQKPLMDWKNTERHGFLTRIQHTAIATIGRVYLINTRHLKQNATLTLCTPENINTPVTARDVIRAHRAHGIGFSSKDVAFMIMASLPNYCLQRVERLLTKFPNFKQWIDTP